MAGIRLILTLQQQLLMDEISAVGLEMDLVLRKLLWNVRLVPILQTQHPFHHEKIHGQLEKRRKGAQGLFIWP